MKPRHQTWHLRLWVALSLLLPALLLLGLATRQERPVEPVMHYGEPKATEARQ